jgi:uncharacterized protein involved in propanediol utilization
MIVVGCDLEPDTRIDTLGLTPADYDDREIGAFQVLRAGMRRAIAMQDAALLGRVSTASARINQRFLPKAELDLLLAECLRLGGCGIQVAHSGTLVGLMFDALLPGVQLSVQRCLDRFAELGLAVTAVINTTSRAMSVTAVSPLDADRARVAAR